MSHNCPRDKPDEVSFRDELAKPLLWSIADLESMEKGARKSLLGSIPIIGPLISSHCSRAEIDSFASEINRQLASRRPVNFGDDPGEAQMISSLCTIIREGMGWASNRFIAVDPLRIVLWSHQDGLDAEEVCFQIEERFNIYLGGADHIIESAKTVGGLADRVLGGTRSRVK